MLEVGNGKLTLAENRAHFSMWAMLAAPLLAGNDLPHMKPEIKAILTNRDVIAIDQDKLGKQGTRVYSDGEVEVWTRHLAGGALAVAVLNAGEQSRTRRIRSTWTWPSWACMARSRGRICGRARRLS